MQHRPCPHRDASIILSISTPLMDRLTAVIRVLDDISDEANPQRAVDANSTNVNLTKAVDLTETLRQTLEDYRKEESFNELWSTARGGTVHRSHGSVLTSVQTSQFGTMEGKAKKKQKAIFISFLLCMSQAVQPGAGVDNPGPREPLSCMF